jgi:hypothetical protein
VSERLELFSCKVQVWSAMADDEIMLCAFPSDATALTPEVKDLESLAKWMQEHKRIVIVKNIKVRPARDTSRDTGEENE